MEQEPRTGSLLVISYLELRKAVGYLGIALPFVLVFGGMLFQFHGLEIRSSISGYYHTAMRDVYVGIMCAIAVFMMCYKGYERKDDIAGVLACIFAVGTALFPTTPVDPSPRDKLIGAVLHPLFAASFFLTLSYFSLFLFTKTDPTKAPTRKKLQRNAVYRVCGYTMLAALVLIVVVPLVPDSAIAGVKKLNPVFWLESIAIEAFGVSWMTKGEAILKDET